MELEKLFCPNIDCPARGQTGQGNLGVHSQKEKRAICNVCNKPFATSSGTIFYRLQTDPQIVIWVLILLANGCPLKAAAIAFGLDERTIKKWWQRAGTHCEGVHNHLVGGSQLDLQHVQADEIKVKVQGGSLWLALAMMVSTRLWLGGEVSPKRDKSLIRRLVGKIRAIALCRPLLLAVDGLTSYVSAFQDAFRSPVHEGEPGRPRFFSWPDIAIVQVIKQRRDGEFSIKRRIVQGCHKQVERLRQASQGTIGVINTAYIERLNATFRQRLPWLTRRTRCLAQQAETITAGMYIVGCFYNFCDYHQALRQRLSVGRFDHRWVQRTPALAAGLTDHRWTAEELLTFKVPPPKWTPPKQRGRPSKETLALIERWC
jgi:transposase-like protein